MGVHEVMLLVMVLFSFCSSTLSAQVSKNLVPENTHENTGDNKIDEKSSTDGCGSGIVNQSKYSTALAEGGHTVGNGEGQSNSSPQGGGNGVVPVYAAGAAAQRNNHKGDAAVYTPCLKGWFAMLIATSASLLLYIPM